LTLLVDYALDRHYPQAARADGAAIALLRSVIRAQAQLVARWLGLGFVHGVMNTDNMSISGETIDYGPCAFLDAFDRARTFSSIDRHGRYAFANQPAIAAWNLARLADSLLPLVDENVERAVEQLNACLEEFAGLFEQAYAAELRHKLGLGSEQAGDFELALELLGLMEADHVDYTLCFRRLSALVEGDEGVAELFRDRERFARWTAQYRQRLAAENAAEVVARMNARNPAFIPRNHRIEQMIAAAEVGDLAPFERLNRVLARPYDEQPDDAELALPPGEEQWAYRTFCGT
jgi:serine/tyrosine/threonine adenylyltransferase